MFDYNVASGITTSSIIQHIFKILEGALI